MVVVFCEGGVELAAEGKVAESGGGFEGGGESKVVGDEGGVEHGDEGGDGGVEVAGAGVGAEGLGP